jgi:hypothetical protein
MSIEAAVVVARDGSPIRWHLPPGRSAVGIPDTRELWDVLWANLDRLAGVAHSHPGAGRPRPSHEDVTTFAACDSALGRRLSWWIATSDALSLFTWRGPGRYDYVGEPIECDGLPHTHWLHELRRLTQGGTP